ncbi:MAG TPA: hypothetical protein VM754_05955 [Actinomycetota bacterium]|nr:hypothetical protein [Actinomycetota bacterium]
MSYAYHDAPYGVNGLLWMTGTLIPAPDDDTDGLSLELFHGTLIVRLARIRLAFTGRSTQGSTQWLIGTATTAA